MRIKLSILFILIASQGFAQTGGDNTYEFLNLSPYSYVTSLGGINVSLESTDPAMALFNPALLNINASENLSLSYVNYLAGINYGYASYARHIEGYGNFAGGITYLNYGKFDRADPSGNITGSFRASEYAINLSWSYKIDSLFTFGVNLKPIISHLERYNSFGLAMDIGAQYTSKNGLFSSGLVIRNIGTQITTYSGTRSKLPFEIIAGASLRLAHAPFRLSLTTRHLEKYKLVHDYIEDDPLSGQKEYTSLSLISENIMRHMIFALEFMPAENFFISGGFNYQRRKEFLIDSRRSTVGLSMGAGIKLSGFDLTLSRSRFHLAGSSTNISILLKPSLLKIRN